LLLRAGQSPLEPRLVTAPGGSANRKRATPIKLVGSREKSNPAKRLNRVWPDTGPTDKRLTAACRHTHAGSFALIQADQSEGPD